MRYDVTYQVAGEERVERVEAPDAASAAAAVQEAHGRSSDMFELIQVHLIDDPIGAGAPEGGEDASGETS